MWILIALMAVAACMSGEVATSTVWAAGSPKPTGYAGSMSCRQCHEKFYQLWSNSWHGLAMQPYSRAFARKQLTPQKNVIKIGGASYRTDISGSTGFIMETGTGSERKYRIEHVLGGKNVYYFLTTLEKGRLQTLPLAYDVRNKKWFDTAASGVRHLPGGRASSHLDWKSTAYTFNSSCYGCHVSQLLSNYDLKTDSYHTTWAEPGINCEACHGPSAEHNRVFQEPPDGQRPVDIKIISWKNFTPEQKSDACSICHTKMSPITATFVPGDRFFDHFDIATLEDPDFYPDGRDLGENYTHTSWRMSPCAKTGNLDCVTCHTSSGRYRFNGEEKANDSCMPCHEKNVKETTAHTRHKEGSAGSKCVSCHMPKTSFARMNRTDHSMLPPTPSATIAYGSPNACNICHTDKDAAWADKHVREWRARDYQAAVLERASLVDAGRRREWSKLPRMVEYIQRRDRDEIFATSLLRLVPASGDPGIIPALLLALGDTSPLVRSAAAAALQDVPTREAIQALVEATGDEYRLVRVRAAASLAGQESLPLDDSRKKIVSTASEEYLASLRSRPDQWDSHFNMGNYHLGRGEFHEAIALYETALKLEPNALMPLVNESIAYARLGEIEKAGDTLERALKIAPDNAAANFNMGLLRDEKKDPEGAKKHLKEALRADPGMAAAAYNLCILLSKDRPDEAVGFCRQAMDLRPHDPRYAYTLAFVQQQRGDRDKAIKILDGLIERYPNYADAYLLLGRIHEFKGNGSEAADVYRRGIFAEGIEEGAKQQMKAHLAGLRVKVPPTSEPGSHTKGNQP